MNDIHIYTVPHQPATNFVDGTGGGKPLRFKFHPRRQIFAWCCRRRRIAVNLSVQVFYDSVNFFCRDGHGCKSK